MEELGGKMVLLSFLIAFHPLVVGFRAMRLRRVQLRLTYEVSRPLFEFAQSFIVMGRSETVLPASILLHERDVLCTSGI